MKLTDQQKIDIVTEYTQTDITCEKLAPKYNVSRSNICKILKRRGVKIKCKRKLFNRKYSLNEHYFDKIDTEDKAYFLGLLYADGNNSKSNFTITLTLQKRDEEILYKFREIINSDRPIYTFKISEKNKNWQDTRCLRFSSKHLSNKAIELGLVPAKSLVLKFPTEEQVPSYLIHHFIRGLFDGDGCLSFRKKNKRPICTISSCVWFLEKMKEIIKTELNIELAIYKYKNVDNNSRHSYIRGGKGGIKIFLDWIYKDATFYLRRKYDKYLEYCKMYEEYQSEPVRTSYGN